MAFGVEAMKLLDRKACNRINKLGDLLRERINHKVFDPLGLRAWAFGLDLISIIHYTDGPIRNYRDARKASEAAKNLYELVNLSLLNNGLWIAEKGEYALSTPKDEEIVDRTVEACWRTSTDLRPAIEGSFPHLIAA